MTKVLFDGRVQPAKDHKMRQLRPEVFISATSDDLRTYRNLVRDELLTAGFHPVVQEHFGPDYRALLDFLEDKVQGCDEVICLVGPVYGAAPEQDRDRPRSYTQIEYDIATRMGKRLWVFVASEHCQLDRVPAEGERERLLQQDHVRNVLAAHKGEPFASHEELRAALLRTLPKMSTGSLPPYYVHLHEAPLCFEGREYELRQLSDAIDRQEPCLIAVTGMGGQGKSTLVWHWLKTCGSSEFFASLWCTAYRGVFTFDMFLDEALDYLLEGKFDRNLYPQIETRSRKLLTLIQRKPVLIVIDGVERWLAAWNQGSEDTATSTDQDRSSHYEGLDDFLRQASALTNGTHLVLTTRALPVVLDHAACAKVPLDENGKSIELQGLDDSAACRLLQDIGVHGEQVELQQAAHAYHNHPLALVVAGSFVAKRYGGKIEHWPQAMGDDLKESILGLFREATAELPFAMKRFMQIAAHGIEPLPLDAIAFVGNHLSRSGRRFLSWMSGIRRHQEKPFSPVRSLDGLRKTALTLAEWNLLEWDGNNQVVRLHPLLKEYFARLTPDSAGMHAALCAWYESQAIVEVPQTLDDVRSRRLAIEHAFRVGNLHECARLMFGPFCKMYSFSEWFYAWGHVSEAEEILGRLSAASTGTLRGQFLLAKANMIDMLGRPDRALADLEAAIEALSSHMLWMSRNRRQNLARAVASRGVFRSETSHCSEAVLDFDKAICMLERNRAMTQNDRIELAKTRVNRGNALWDMGNWTSALADHDRAVAVLEEIHTLKSRYATSLLAWALSNRGIVLSDLGRHEDCIVDLERAVDLYLHLEQDRYGEFSPLLAQTRITLGNKLYARGQPNEALIPLGQAVEAILRMIDNGRKDVDAFLALGWMNRGRARIALRQWSDALRDADRAVSLYRRVVVAGAFFRTGSLAHALTIRAEARYGAGDREGEEKDREEGLASLRELLQTWRDDSDIAMVYFQRLWACVCYLSTADPVSACRFIDQILDEVEIDLSRPVTSEGLQIEARRKMVEVETALRAFQDAAVAHERLVRLKELKSQARSATMETK